MYKKLRKKLKKGKFVKVDPKTKKTMSSIKSKNTKSTEQLFRMFLIRARIKGWHLHEKNIEGSPDIFFHKNKIAIFLDGCFWHGCPGCGHIPHKNRDFWRTKIKCNKERDRFITKKLQSKGIKIFRIWEHAIKDKTNCNRILKSLKNYLASSQSEIQGVIL